MQKLKKKKKMEQTFQEPHPKAMYISVSLEQRQQLYKQHIDYRDQTIWCREAICEESLSAIMGKTHCLLGFSVVKKLPSNSRDMGSILGSGRLLGEGKGNSSIFAWKISWTEEPGRLQSVGLLKSQTQLTDQVCMQAHCLLLQQALHIFPHERRSLQDLGHLSMSSQDT